jgi:hypothetical protein
VIIVADHSHRPMQSNPLQTNLGDDVQVSHTR